MMMHIQPAVADSCLVILTGGGGSAGFMLAAAYSHFLASILNEQRRMTNEQLLAEIEDLLRTTPPYSAFAQQQTDEVLSWLGRVAAAIKKWDFAETLFANSHIRELHRSGGTLTDLQGVPAAARDQMISIHLMMGNGGSAYNAIRSLLYQARSDLMMKTAGPMTVVIGTSKPFEYFDEIRKIIALARGDLFFVDPYIDPEFVSRYMPQVVQGVKVRLLTSSKRIAALMPSVDAFVAQSCLTVQVRTVASGLHDRYVFVDETSCYQSGASFKDGAKKAPTTLTQVTDAFTAVLQTYEKLWKSALIQK